MATGGTATLNPRILGTPKKSKKPSNDEDRTPTKLVNNRKCMICDLDIITSQYGYLVAANRNINERVTEVVGAQCVQPDGAHPHSKYICRACYRILERIEKGNNVRNEFTTNYYKTHDNFVATKNLDAAARTKRMAKSPSHGEKRRSSAPVNRPLADDQSRRLVSRRQLCASSSRSTVTQGDGHLKHSTAAEQPVGQVCAI